MTNAELLAEIERRRTKAMTFEREHGLEGLVTLSIEEAALVKSALRGVEAAREALRAYDCANPVRTADIHPRACKCLRCAMDHLHSTLAALSEVTP